MLWTELRSHNDELRGQLDVAVAEAQTETESRVELQAALDEARSDAIRAREQVAKREEEAAAISEQAAADAAALESLEYLHGVLPSHADNGFIGDRALSAPRRQKIESGGDSGEDELGNLRLELREALLLAETRRTELEPAQLALQAAEQKYSELVASHAEVRRRRCGLITKTTIPISLTMMKARRVLTWCLRTGCGGGDTAR